MLGLIGLGLVGSALVERFPDAPAARGMPSATLKTLVEDRKGHDRRYAIDETKAREELGYQQKGLPFPFPLSTH